MKTMHILSFVLLLGSLFSCQDDLVSYDSGDVRVSLEKGENWLHDYPLFLGIDKKNAPQIAIWLEDTQGHYLSTVYVTYKAGHQAWVAAHGNRRKESLPYWAHARGVEYPDGLYLPTKSQPLTDGISGATPRGSFALKVTPTSVLHDFVLKVEINHSTDFNETYSKGIALGDPHYSGGKDGSGQPALVYAATIHLDDSAREYQAQLIGHSSPDGSDGTLYDDMTGVTTALHIVQSIKVYIQ